MLRLCLNAWWPAHAEVLWLWKSEMLPFLFSLGRATPAFFSASCLTLLHSPAFYFSLFPPILIWFVHPTTNPSINSHLVICLFLFWMPLLRFFLIAPHHSFSLFLTVFLSLCIQSSHHLPPLSHLLEAERSDKRNRQLLVSTLGITVVVLAVDS